MKLSCGQKIVLVKVLLTGETCEKQAFVLQLILQNRTRRAARSQKGLDVDIRSPGDAGTDRHPLSVNEPYCRGPAIDR